jgi:NodT family efflux transporter outer membrane factor (OMF) lipoprotein
MGRMTSRGSRASRVRTMCALLVGAWLSGCAVGPDFAPPPAPDVNGYTPEPLAPAVAGAATPGGNAQRFVRDLDLPGQWWTLFHSHGLNELIDQAFAANPDLQAAQAALVVARENVYVQEGAYFPAVDGNFTGSRQKFEIGQPSDTSSVFNLFTGQINIAYTPDVFGANRRAVETLAAQEDAQRFTLEATYLTLISNLAGAAVQEASLRGQIAATQTIVKIESDVLDLMRKQFKLGQIAEGDVVAQQAALAQVEQTLPPLQKQLLQNRDLLAALTGGFPNQRMPQIFTLAALRLPRDLPVSLPSNVVEQRPDIRAAEANLQSASAQIGVAIANRLPNITLSGGIGSTALSVDTLFTPGFGFWNAAAGVTQPLFHGGALLHKQLAAQAAYDQAAAQYKSVVHVAFQNVADSLRAIQTDAVALQKAVASEAASGRSLAIVRKRMELGDVNYLALLNAQQTYQQAVLSLAQAKAARYADTVALFQALGGGWWHRSDVAPERPLSITDVFQ